MASLGLLSSSTLVVVVGFIIYYGINNRTEYSVEIAGKIDEISKELHWKLEEFPHSKQSVYSPSFTFLNESWYLGIESEEDGMVLFLDMYLFRESAGLPVRLKVSFSLKTSFGTEFKELHHTYNYEKAEKGYGYDVFLNGFEFSKKKSQLVHAGTITVICTLRLLEDGNAGDMQEPPELCRKSQIHHDLKDLYFEKENSDVILRVQEQDFPAHKIILMARSPVFASILQNDTKENAADVVTIGDCEPSTFSKFLRFLYFEDVSSLSSDSAFSLYTAADKYGVADLKTRCVEFMKDNLSVDTFFETITLAFRYYETELLDLAFDFFVKSAPTIIGTTKWQSFLIENPTQSNELLIRFMESTRKPSR